MVVLVVGKAEKLQMYKKPIESVSRALEAMVAKRLNNEKNIVLIFSLHSYLM